MLFHTIADVQFITSLMLRKGRKGRGEKEGDFKHLTQLVCRSSAWAFLVRASWLSFFCLFLVPSKQVAVLARFVHVPTFSHKIQHTLIGIKMRDLQVIRDECTIVLPTPPYQMHWLLVGVAVDSYTDPTCDVFLWMFVIVLCILCRSKQATKESFAITQNSVTVALFDLLNNLRQLSLTECIHSFASCSFGSRHIG
jgi:hypothetical protein